MAECGQIRKLFIVTSCYNEEEVLPITAPKFVDALRSLVKSGAVARDSGVIVVDDGSRDGTAAFLAGFAAANPEVRVRTLPLNRGQQRALVEGMRMARESGAGAVLTMDCDGQDDFGSVEKMVAAHLEGAEVVYGVRGDRSSDGAVYRAFALAFYRIMELTGSKAVFNHAEFRLMSAAVVDAVLSGWRDGVFLRGYVPTLGFKSAFVVYCRDRRSAGKSHYNWWTLAKLALMAILRR